MSKTVKNLSGQSVSQPRFETRTSTT